MSLLLLVTTLIATEFRCVSPPALKHGADVKHNTTAMADVRVRAAEKGDVPVIIALIRELAVFEKEEHQVKVGQKLVATHPLSATHAHSLSCPDHGGAARAGRIHRAAALPCSDWRAGWCAGRVRTLLFLLQHMGWPLPLP